MTHQCLRVIRLIDGFECSLDGQAMVLPRGCQRLVAFLALWERPVRRSFVSGSLWPDSDAEHANACLRSALWRLHETGGSLIQATSGHVALDESVEVDYREAVAWSRSVLTDGEPLPPSWTMREISGLGREVLPDWYDEWVEQAQEHFRQLRLHALEKLCAQLAASGRYGEALLAGFAALAIEPLRESSQRAVISVHLAEHNQVEAIRQYRRYERLLDAQLSLRPSADLRELVGVALAG